MLRDLDRKSLASCFLALSIIGLIFVLPTSVSAAPTGTHFDHIVIIAMENTPYNSIIGGGSDPFINSMLPGAAALDMNSYSSSPSISGCSAGCYTAFTSGNTYGVSDGVSSGSVSQTNLFDRLTSAGLTWQGYCENGCPRSGDHYPCLQYSDTYQSANCATLSGPLVGDSQVLSTFNSASPANYIWLTPDDTDNMHSSSVSTGDSWLQSFLIGSGSLSSPASGSLLSTSLFTNSNYHTLLLLWWDECSSSCSSGPFGSNDKAEIYYGSMVSKGLRDKTTQWTDYNSLRTIEDNWGLTCLSNECNPTTGISELFGAGGPPLLSDSFTFNPSAPTTSATITFTGSASGGTSPYTYSWSFGDGSTGSGATATHSYSSAGQYTVTLTATDSSSKTASSSQTLTVSSPSPPTVSFIYSPSTPTANTAISFTATPSGGVSPYTYSWTFGDGATSTGASPTHSYATAGTYSVAVTVTDSNSLTGSSSHSVVVSAMQTPDFSIAANPASLTIQVSGSGSTSVQLSSISGLSGAASLTANGDSGLSESLSQSSLSLTSGGSGSVTMTVSVLSGANTGSHSIQVTATVGSLQHSVTVSVQVSSPTQLAGSFSSPPWTLNAHGGGVLPTIAAGVLSTTTSNPSSTSYSGTYNSNGFIGSEDWCGCVPTSLNYTTFSINGTFTGLSVSNPSNHDYTIENSFYFYLPSGVSGTNCGSSVMNSHWLDVEIFYSGRPSSPSSYIGCASAGDINYREVENSLQPGQSFQLNGFNITGVYQRALSMQGLPTTTNGYLASIEVGTEGYGINYVTANWYVVTIAISGSLPVSYLLSLAVPGLVTATPGSKIVFIVNATDSGVGRIVAFSAAGLPYGASFDQATGRFSWSPTSSEMGNYNVTFTATDDGSPPRSSSKSVLIMVQQASQPPPSHPPSSQQGPGVCLQCLFTPTAMTALWIVTVSGLTGFLVAIGAFYMKARSHLAVARRRRRVVRQKFGDR